MPQHRTTHISTSRCDMALLQIHSSEAKERKSFSDEVQKKPSWTWGEGCTMDLNNSHEYGRFQPGLGAPTKGRVNSAAPYGKATGALLLVWKRSEEMRKVVKNFESLVQFGWSRTKSLIAANNSAWLLLLHPGGDFHPKLLPRNYTFSASSLCFLLTWPNESDSQSRLAQ